MQHQIICSWLGMPADRWPPDHYALLGLNAGEARVDVIEQHVHDRLAKVRCYQISNPEQATEAMNRLAQAFMCLTDPEAKKTYDGTLGLCTAETVAVATLPRPKRKLEDTCVSEQTQLDWSKVQVPPPVRGASPAPPPANGQTAETPAPPVVAESAPAPGTPLPASTAAAAQPAPLSQPVDSVYEIALTSFEAKRGLGTARGLYERIFYTRQLIWAWQQAGKYLNRPKRFVARPAELRDLAERFADITELMNHFPQILGRPGQPGYRVVAMARLAMTEAMLQNLDGAQRTALARDWVAGLVVLKEHRQFLRKELKRWRRHGRVGRVMRAVRAALNDHPILVCTGFALLALLLMWWFVHLAT